MNYFIDTNIAIGYSLKCDKWHESAKEFIDKTKDNHDIIISDFVQREFEDTFDEKTRNIKLFMDNMSELINKKEDIFQNYYAFENYILNHSKRFKLEKNKKIKIIELFWMKHNGFFNNIYEFELNFIEFINNYYFNQKTRKNDLESLLTYHHCGINNYLNYPDLKEKLKNDGVHNKDDIIIIDCHDFAIKNDLEVNFVTSDKDFYNKILELHYLKIKEYYLCN